MNGIIYLIRHTKLVVEEGICYGITDLNLTESFNEDVGIILKKLEGVPIGRVYSSPLERCKQLAQKFNKRVRYDNRLIEMNFGEWEGLPWDEIFQREEGKKWFANYLEERCPDGESFWDLFRRVQSFAEEIPLDAKATLIITHAGVIRTFLSALNIITPEEMFSVDISFGEVLKIENRDFKLL